MKRTGNLASAVLDRDNLLGAYHRAARGKRDRRPVRAFAADLDRQIDRLACQLSDGSFPFGQHHRFTVHDPKLRVIHAAAFPERVLHHALMAVCEPVFEQVAIHDSYACRRGKGSLAAVTRAVRFAGTSSWYLKMDVHKYFDTVDHEILKKLLCQKIKDPWILSLFAKIITSYDATPGKGLPIGSLTSQHLANFYLWPLDRFVKETLGARGYLRYMDDFIVWHSDRSVLKEWRFRIEAFLNDRLRLTLRGQAILNRSITGMDFLGYRIYPQGIRVNRANTSRLSRRWRQAERLHKTGFLSERELQRVSESIAAFAGHARLGGRQVAVFKGYRSEEATSVSTAAAPGTTTPGTVVHPTATGTRLTTGTTTSASASLEAQSGGLNQAGIRTAAPEADGKRGYAPGVGSLMECGEGSRGFLKGGR